MDESEQAITLRERTRVVLAHRFPNLEPEQISKILKTFSDVYLSAIWDSKWPTSMQNKENPVLSEQSNGTYSKMDDTWMLANRETYTLSLPGFAGLILVGRAISKQIRNSQNCHI